MQWRGNRLWLLALAAALALGLTACGGGAEETPAETQPAAQEETRPAAREEAPDTVTYSNDGLVLTVPAAYDSLVRVTAPEDSEDGTLFSVSELASLEWGQKQHPGEDWGDGWLFDIGRMDEDALHAMQCYDMFGAVPFARDDGGTYYVYYHPTDVRLVRESYDFDPDSPDVKQWGELNDWAWSMQETFAADNGLTPCSFTNTAVDMCLAQVAYQDEPYTLTALEYGTLTPQGVDGTPYLEEIMDGASFTLVEDGQRPDGEYIILELPQTGERLDFFLADGNYVREVYDGEETLYRAVYADGDTEAALVARDWYDALAQAAGAA